MTVLQIHKLASRLIVQGRGDADVAIDTATFYDNSDATIQSVTAGKYRRVQGVDDSGPHGPKFPFFVLTGDFKL